MKKLVLLVAVCLFASFSANAADVLSNANAAAANIANAAANAAVDTAAAQAQAVVPEAPEVPVVGVSDDENWERKKFLVLQDITNLNKKIEDAKKAGQSTTDLEKQKSELFKNLDELDTKIKAAAAK